MQTNYHHIIEACARQDSKAQEQLYKLLYPAMMKLCLRYTSGAMDTAAALYNQAMLKVFRHIGQYRGEGEPQAWIRRIVVNTCIDHCRSGTSFRSAELNEEIAGANPIVPEVYNRISSEEIINLIHSLPKNTGLVFNLFVFEGYKHEEIGTILGISAGTSKWHLNEARKLLKQRIRIYLKLDLFANAI